MSSQRRKQKATLPTQHPRSKAHLRLLHTLYMTSVWPFGLSEQAPEDCGICLPCTSSRKHGERAADMKNHPDLTASVAENTGETPSMSVHRSIWSLDQMCPDSGVHQPANIEDLMRARREYVVLLRLPCNSMSGIRWTCVGRLPEVSGAICNICNICNTQYKESEI